MGHGPRYLSYYLLWFCKHLNWRGSWSPLAQKLLESTQPGYFSVILKMKAFLFLLPLAHSDICIPWLLGGALSCCIKAGGLLSLKGVHTGAVLCLGQTVVWHGWNGPWFIRSVMSSYVLASGIMYSFIWAMLLALYLLCSLLPLGCRMRRDMGLCWAIVARQADSFTCGSSVSFGSWLSCYLFWSLDLLLAAHWLQPGIEHPPAV